MRKKIYDEKLEKEILKILTDERRFLSIREITKRLKAKGIKRSPQIVKRHLISLLEKEKITNKDG